MLETSARLLRLLSLLQVNLLAGLDTGLTAADVESLLPLLDEHRDGVPIAVGEGHSVGRPDEPITFHATRAQSVGFNVS